MSKQILVIVVLVLVLAAGGWFLLKSNKQITSSPSPAPVTSDVIVTPSQESTTSSQPGIKEFTVTGESFKFTPNTLTVSKGDKVKVTFKNSGGMHDFVIDEFNVKTKVLSVGAQETVEFTADKSGSFEFYCSVGNHRAMGMKGTLTVN